MRTPGPRLSALPLAPFGALIIKNYAKSRSTSRAARAAEMAVALAVARVEVGRSRVLDPVDVNPLLTEIDNVTAQMPVILARKDDTLGLHPAFPKRRSCCVRIRRDRDGLPSGRSTRESPRVRRAVLIKPTGNHY
jgi:hypothetical protein